MANKSIVKIVPVSTPEGRHTRYMIEIERCKSLLSEADAEEFITHLREVIGIVRTANERKQ